MPDRTVPVVYMYLFSSEGDGDNAPPTVYEVQAASTLDKVVVSFSEEMAESAADVTKYTITNGVTVLSATLLANQN